MAVIRVTAFPAKSLRILEGFLVIVIETPHSSFFEI